MEFTDFKRCVTLWQEVLTALLKGYVEKAYNNAKSKWMSNNVEVAYLDASHPNFEAEYKIVIHKDLEDFYGKIEELKNALANNEFSKTIQVAQTPNAFDALYIAGHLYQPLLYLDEKRYKHPEIGNLIEIKPVQLNQGERDFVCDIQRYFDKAHFMTNPCKVRFLDKTITILNNEMEEAAEFFFQFSKGDNYSKNL